MSVSAPDTKAALRRQFRSYRRTLSGNAYVRKSRQIATRALSLPEVRTAKVVHVYWPLIERKEVDTRPLIRTLHAAGQRVVLPVVTAFPPDAPQMEHRVYCGDDSLRANRWGIPEPTAAATVPPSALDVVLLPALGAGTNGHRIGNGAGYYDAFLAPLAASQTPCPRIVLTYEDTLVEHVPAANHDVPATHIVTESRTLAPAP